MHRKHQMPCKIKTVIGQNDQTLNFWSLPGLSGVSIQPGFGIPCCEILVTLTLIIHRFYVNQSLLIIDKSYECIAVKVKEIVSPRYLNFILYAAKGDIPKPITRSQPD